MESFHKRNSKRENLGSKYLKEFQKKLFIG